MKNKKAGALMFVWFVLFILALLFMWKFGLFEKFWEFIKCMWENKLRCLT